MKKIIYVCDRCQDQVEPSEIRECLDFDFCEDCAEMIAEHLMVWLGDPEEQVEEEEEAEELIEEEDEEEAEEEIEEIPRKNVRIVADWNKACALRQAGWTYKEIGEELGIGSSTVHKYMQKYNMMEEYGKGRRIKIG